LYTKEGDLSRGFEENPFINSGCRNAEKLIYPPILFFPIELAG
jgi:hypothetical protein